MSWLISRAMMEGYGNSRSSPGLVEEYSAATCSDGEPSAPLSVMPTPHKFWRNDKTMEFSDLSQFGLTCEPLTESRGEELLKSFLAAFPVRISASQEEGGGLKGSGADCGLNSSASFAKWTPEKSMWKIPQLCLFEDLELSLATWPRWGSMRNGECFHAQMSAEFIYENESGLTLPTPRACSAMSANITENTANARFRNLETVIARLTLPTLGANEGKGSSKNRYINSPDYHGAKMSEGLRTCETDPIYLNPLFAELTMMWPLGWTDLKPLGMDKFQEWQQQHGDYSMAERKSNDEGED